MRSPTPATASWHVPNTSETPLKRWLSNLRALFLAGARLFTLRFGLIVSATCCAVMAVLLPIENDGSTIGVPRREMDKEGIADASGIPSAVHRRLQDMGKTTKSNMFELRAAPALLWCYEE
jgi:hypothetical protein